MISRGQSAFRWMVRRNKAGLRRLLFIKTFVSEWLAIYRKRALYGDVRWTAQQQREFDEFWIDVYGRRISNRWHRLYQRINGVFRVDYIPEILFTTRVEPRLNDAWYAGVLSDKALVESIAALTADVVVPKTLILNVDKRFFDCERSPISPETAHKILSEAGRFVVKPIRGGSSGRGVGVVSLGPDAEQRSQDIEQLLDSCSRDYIVQEVIEPHEAFRVLHPHSINTLRITTYLAGEGVHHGPVALRMGTGGSHVDNIHAGGLGTAVSTEGQLSRYAYRLGYGNDLSRFEAHPDSGVVFEHHVLPRVQDFIEAARRLHGSIPQLGIVSWDLTLDVHDRLVLIELNTQGQGIWFPQIVAGEGFFGEYLREVLH